eukprot:CAMPEP_0204606044 /NCGR_PEP_ID=MMETSP0661-20131031/58860_1 /ASSEMBLY_ACC=CAM_ASM_000606 /TAXON_ID=109239 /ORGANISM="Alexandrium margalefi, Strain AMGDE01CS-322" /LENGTH=71 /DNA_ID=CAMNT_0051617335 /DNA_START=116 /DNA_END=331 /DNA_ORIENTATION=+
MNSWLACEGMRPSPALQAPARVCAELASLLDRQLRIVTKVCAGNACGGHRRGCRLRRARSFMMFSAAEDAV